MDQQAQKELVRARYGGIAEAAGAASCCTPASSCCGPAADPNSKSRGMGYSEAGLAAVPDGANLGLGCGKPQASSGPQPGGVLVGFRTGGRFGCVRASRAG